MDKNITPGNNDRPVNPYHPAFPEIAVDDFARGQTVALLALVGLLVREHPEAQRLRATFEESRQRLLAHAVPSLVSDEYIEGIQETHSRVAPLIGLVNG